MAKKKFDFKKWVKGLDYKVAIVLAVAAVLFILGVNRARQPAAMFNPNPADAANVYFTHVGYAIDANRLLYEGYELPPGYAYDGVNPLMREFESARVVQVLYDDAKPDPYTENIMVGMQELRVELLTGRYKGQQFELINGMTRAFSKHATVGTRLLVYVFTDYTDTDAHGRPYISLSVMNYDRSLVLYGTLIVFFLLTALIGGKVGARSIVGLFFTIACLLLILVPLLLRGFPPVPLTIALTVFVTIVSFVLLDGINKKTLSAMAGTILGVLVAALFAFIVGTLCHIDGLRFGGDETDALLQAQYQGTQIRLRGLFVSGILIAALGAVSDVGMSIASSINELHSVNGKLTSKQLFRSGMNIGRDAIGTMTNTLILAFAGSALVPFLLVAINKWDYAAIINNDFIVGELITGIAGSTGIILAVPITALIASWLVKTNLFAKNVKRVQAASPPKKGKKKRG
ncbi:MAG: YibE/F family protein [Clostridiales bacterium]|nr:YibE/F family protein [Clostridiales bacterium]